MPEVFEDMSVLQALGHFKDYNYQFPSDMNNLGILSPSNSSQDSQMTGSTPSPMSLSTSPYHSPGDFITLSNATVLGNPYIEIIEQPVDKFRFRYKSEMMGTHGSLAGANHSSSRKKHAPTVELRNYPGAAVIRCTLVTADPERRGPHAHRLVRRVGNQDEDDPHENKVSPETTMQVAFHGMGIIHTAKKHIKEELVKKKRFLALEEAKRRNVNVTSLSVREETDIKMEAESAQKWMSLNRVALCFQAFSPNINGILTPVTEPVYSNAINNLKSALTGELKICRVDKIAGSCDGNDEIFMLVEKVGKKNIKIRFFETNEDDQEIWSDIGHFSELDVHHQYAIVFRTPPYKNTDISEPKQVFIQLYRPTDGDCSEPVQFTYKPSERMNSRKRQRMSFGSSELLFPALNNITAATTTAPTQIDVSIPPNNSAELAKLLADSLPSDEMRNLLTSLDLDKYLQYSPDENLKFDRRSSNQDKDMFAKDVVQKIAKLLKSGESNVTEKVLALLKERRVYGDTPLHSALRHRQLHLVKFILMLIANNPVYESIINAQNSSGRTCLHYAAEQNQPEVTKGLLTLGADANECDDDGFSPLHVAVKIPEAGECVEILLKDGNVNIEARVDTGWSAFHLAAGAGSIRAIEALVKANVDVNSTDASYGRTALHIAVEGGHKEIVDFLLKKTQIDVNKRNFSGNTALHSAVVNTGERAEELCELLIKYGADPLIQNHNRETAKESQIPMVKNEVESDEENHESEGQTSFDLASEKPEILKLLAGGSNSVESANSSPGMTIKQEIVDEEVGDGNKFLDEKTISLLVPILDESMAWEKLAKFSGYDFLRPSLKTSPTSPSRTLLDYMDLQADVSVEKLRTLLLEMQETKAVEIIDEMISRRTTQIIC